MYEIYNLVGFCHFDGFLLLFPEKLHVGDRTEFLDGCFKHTM